MKNSFKKLLISGMVVCQSLAFVPNFMSVKAEEDRIQSRWVGTMDTKWITASDKKSQARFRIVFNDINMELGSIDSVLSIRSLVGGSISGGRITKKYRVDKRTMQVEVSFYDSKLGSKTGLYTISI